MDSLTGLLMKPHTYTLSLCQKCEVIHSENNTPFLQGSFITCMRKSIPGLFIREHLPEEDEYPPPQMTDFDVVQKFFKQPVE